MFFLQVVERIVSFFLELIMFLFTGRNDDDSPLVSALKGVYYIFISVFIFYIFYIVLIKN